MYPSSLENAVSSSKGSRQVRSSLNLQVEGMNYSTFTVIGLPVRNLRCLSGLVELLYWSFEHAMTSFHGNLKGLYFLRISGIYYYSAEVKVSHEQALGCFTD